MRARVWLDHEFIRRIVRASYDGVYVDEYQDCSVAQHGIVVKLARDLPSRVLGDPLQGIFDFGGQNPVNWPRDVEANFVCLGVLDVPHRWIQVGADGLGAWLDNIRQCLEQGQPINLSADRPAARARRRAQCRSPSPFSIAGQYVSLFHLRPQAHSDRHS